MTDKPTTRDMISPVPRGLKIESADHELDLDDADDSESTLIDRVRERLGIGDEISDVTIAASLAAIAARADNRGRWLAAFGSPLGRWLASRGTDLNTTLNIVLALAPKAAS